jgi:acetyl esterase
VVERIGATVVRGIGAMPPAAARLLAFRPVRSDGMELDPRAQLAVKLLDRFGGPGYDELTPVEARSVLLEQAATFSGSPPDVATENLVVGPADAGVAARLYRPPRTDRAPLLVWYHGGGWVLGDLDSHDAICRYICHRARMYVLAVDFRLAPEHPFPAAVDDALAAFRWAAEHATDMGADPQALAVAGDSAGGNLSAVVAQLTAKEGGPAPAYQVLIYPVTDVSTKHPSYRLFPKGYFLTEAEMDWYCGHYLPDPEAAFDPRVSPLLEPDLAGLPPAYVATAGFDVLRDEGEAYARRLREAGVPTMLRRHTGLVHGFINAAMLMPPARAAVDEALAALRWNLTGTPL